MQKNFHISKEFFIFTEIKIYKDDKNKQRNSS